MRTPRPVPPGAVWPAWRGRSVLRDRLSDRHVPRRRQRQQLRALARGRLDLGAHPLPAFLAYLAGLLRRAEPDGGWLSNLALAAGASGLLLKLISHGPEIAIHHDHLAKGTPLYQALDHMVGAATILSLYPLAIYAAAVALPPAGWAWDDALPQR